MKVPRGLVLGPHQRNCHQQHPIVFQNARPLGNDTARIRNVFQRLRRKNTTNRAGIEWNCFPVVEPIRHSKVARTGGIIINADVFAASGQQLPVRHRAATKVDHDPLKARTKVLYRPVDGAATQPKWIRHNMDPCWRKWIHQTAQELLDRIQSSPLRNTSEQPPNLAPKEEKTINSINIPIRPRIRLPIRQNSQRMTDRKVHRLKSH